MKMTIRRTYRGSKYWEMVIEFQAYGCCYTHARHTKAERLGWRCGTTSTHSEKQENGRYIYTTKLFYRKGFVPNFGKLAHTKAESDAYDYGKLVFFRNN